MGDAKETSSVPYSSGALCPCVSCVYSQKGAENSTRKVEKYEEDKKLGGRSFKGMNIGHDASDRVEEGGGGDGGCGYLHE